MSWFTMEDTLYERVTEILDRSKEFEQRCGMGQHETRISGNRSRDYTGGHWNDAVDVRNPGELRSLFRMVLGL